MVNSNHIVQSEVESLHQRLSDLEENLQVLEEKLAQYVSETDIPPQLKKDIRANKRKINSLKKRLEFEGSNDQQEEQAVQKKVKLKTDLTHPGIITDSLENEQQALKEYENKVFVSYAWDSESESTVDELERAFAESGIHIIRDKKDLDYKGSIEAFEQRIGKGQCVVLVISDKYLRSEHCMYELVEVDKNRSIRDRIFPIVLTDALIYKATDRLTYIKHWDEQIEQLSQAIKQLNVVSNLEGITTDLDKFSSIRSNFAHLTDLLSEMNTLTPELHAANGYSTLVESVKNVMIGKKKFFQADKLSAQPDVNSNIRNELAHKENIPISKSNDKLINGRLINMSSNLAGSEIKSITSSQKDEALKEPQDTKNPSKSRGQKFSLIDTRDFVNRRDERRDLERLNGRPYVQIYGPAGYGKTYLMTKICHRYENEFKWLTFWVDFKDDNSIRESEIQVAKVILEQLDFNNLDGSKEELTEQLCSLIARCGSKVVFFFESIDLAKNNVLEYIEDTLLPDLRDTVRIRNVRAFFETRYPLIREHRFPFPSQHFQLSNFKEEHVEEMVEFFLDRDKVDLEIDEMDKIVKSLLDITMGHPKCMKLLIDKLSPYYALPIDRVRFKDRKRLFSIVKPIIDKEIFIEVTPGDLTLFQTISTFRLISPTFIHCLINTGHLPLNDLTTTFARLDFIKKFVSIAWMGYNDDYEVLYKIDPVIRHILTLDLLFKNENKFLELHKQALLIYVRMIDGKDEMGERESASVTASDQILYIIEALYHCSRVLEVTCKSDPEFAFKEIQNLLNDSLLKLKPQHEMPTSIYIFKLREKMEIDLDLKPLFNFLLGTTDGYQKILDILDNSVSNR